MMRSALLAAVVMLVLGCGMTADKNKLANDVVKWGNRGIALGQCIQEAAATANPEGGSQACVTQWLPELPADATMIASNLARCVRTAVQNSASLPAADRQKARIQDVANCTAQYGPPLFQAVQTAVR